MFWFFNSFHTRAPDVKNISFYDKIVPCTIIVIIIVHGIIYDKKFKKLTSGACAFILLHAPKVSTLMFIFGLGGPSVAYLGAKK